MKIYYFHAESILFLIEYLQSVPALAHFVHALSETSVDLALAATRYQGIIEVTKAPNQSHIGVSETFLEVGSGGEDIGLDGLEHLGFGLGAGVQKGSLVLESVGES